MYVQVGLINPRMQFCLPLLLNAAHTHILSYTNKDSQSIDIYYRMLKWSIVKESYEKLNEKTFVGAFDDKQNIVLPY